jgi:hypothetical protein
MTDTTRSIQINSSQPSVSDIEAAISHSFTTVNPLGSTSSETSIDRDHAIDEFLKYYESFVGSSVESPLVWQSQSFSGKKSTQIDWSSPWVKVGALGLAGISALGALALVAADKVLPPHEVSQKSAAPRKSFSKRQQKALTSPPIANQITPDPVVEFSRHSRAFDRAQIPKVVSPSIRAPLPGQVISQQSRVQRFAPVTSLHKASMRSSKRVPQTSQSTKSPAKPSTPLVNPRTSISPIQSVKEALPKKLPTPTTTESAPLPLLQQAPIPEIAPVPPTLIPPQEQSIGKNVQPGSLGEVVVPSVVSQEQSIGKNVQAGSSGEVVVPVRLVPPQEQRIEKNVQPGSSDEIAPLPSMPPQRQPIRKNGQSGSSNEISKTVLPILATAIQSQVVNHLQSPPTKSTSESDLTTLPTVTESTKQLTPLYTKVSSQQSLPILPNVLSGQISVSLQHSISNARTIQDFIKLLPKIPKEMQVAVLSLTSQAAIAVPKADEFERFQIFRFPKVTYQKAWALLTQSKDSNQALPPYGFIDYHRQVIVLITS